MYHIKNDKRCLRSAQKIAAALGALLADKPLAEISVSDIQRASGIGRATFYRLFDNIDDVLLYAAEEEFRVMYEISRDMSWTELTEHLIENVLTESRGLVNIASSGKAHLLSKALRSVLAQKAEYANYEFDNTSRYVVAIFVGGCLSLVTAWDENGRKEPISDLAALMQKAFDYSKIEELLSRSAV